jgi:hypothetical protein
MAKPRKAGLRTRSGRLSRAGSLAARDEGTAELQRHRLALVNGSADPVLSSSLAGIMLAHGIISPDQKAAADRYRALRAALYGAVMPRREPGQSRPPELEEHRIVKLARDFNRMVRPLTVSQKLALTDLALDLWPRWLRAQLLGLELDQEAACEREILLAGLEVIRARTAPEACKP